MALADEVGDVGDDSHRVFLRRPDLLDQRQLVAWRGALDARQRVVEAVVLAQDAPDRRFVLEDQRHRGVMHLQRERVLDLLRPMHTLVGLVEPAAVAIHGGEELHADDADRDDQAGDEQERGEQLDADRGLYPCDPPNEPTQRGAGQQKRVHTTAGYGRRRLIR